MVMRIYTFPRFSPVSHTMWMLFLGLFYLCPLVRANVCVSLYRLAPSDGPRMFVCLKQLRIRDSVVGIASGYGLDDRGVGVRVPVESRIFFTSSRPALGSTQPPIQWVPGALSPGVKRQWREGDHSLPTSSEVKKMWIYTPTPPYAFMA
jgi:hypothetical protein